MVRISHLLGHWLACRDATRLLSQLEEREPGTIERIRLRWHLAACEACTKFREQLGCLREAVRRYGR